MHHKSSFRCAADEARDDRVTSGWWKLLWMASGKQGTGKHEPIPGVADLVFCMRGGVSWHHLQS